ncbi:MAG: hypothetical protein JSV37_02025 [Anaerolineaceae bacterium]|nr:MAG: hypothetical protein JSV37_02025 [Anaerolineaceae bacterium]
MNTLRGVKFNGNDILVAVDYGGNIIQWDRWSWEEISRIELHQEQKRVIFMPSGLILDDVEGILPVVDLDGHAISSIELPTLSYRFVSVSEDGQQLMILVHEGVRVFDIATGEETLFLAVEDARNVTITPDWSLFVASDADQNVHIINLSNGDYLLTQKLDVSEIRRIEISPDGNLLGLYVIGSDLMTPYIEVWGLIDENNNE